MNIPIRPPWPSVGIRPAIGRRFRAWLVALAVSSFCLWLGAWAVRCEAYDSLIDAAQKGTANSTVMLRAAVRIRPDRSAGWRLLAAAIAMSDPAAARRLAARAVAVNPESWENWRQLGLIDYQLGDLPRAHAEARRAGEFNNGYEAHFLLANLDFLLGDQSEFWSELRKAMRVAGQSQQLAVVTTALRLAPDQIARFKQIIPMGRVSMSLLAARALSGAGHDLDALDVVNRSPCAADPPTCREATLQIVDHAVSAALAGIAPPEPLLGASIVAWNAAIRAGALRQDTARSGGLGNGNFQFNWSGPAFSWAMGDWKNVGVEAGADGASNAARISFDGTERDDLHIFSQWVAVAPATRFRVGLKTRCDCAGSTGLSLVVRAPERKNLVLASLPIVASGTWSSPSAGFEVPLGVHAISVGIEYHRQYATSPINGTVWIAAVALRSQ